MHVTFLALLLPLLASVCQGMGDVAPRHVGSTATATGADSELTVHPDDALHQLATLELGPDGATIEYMSDFDGELSVWAASESLDPFLRLEFDARDEPLEDDDSGGGTTAWLRLEVEAGQRAAVHVQSLEGTRGTVELHLVASPETVETRAAAASAAKDLEQAASLQEAGEVEAARELIVAVVHGLLTVPDGDRSARVAAVAWTAGFSAYRVADTERASAAFGATHAHRDRVLPPDHPDLLNAKLNLATTRYALGDLTGALALQEYVHAAWERLLPPDHPDLLLAKQNLVPTRYALGDLKGVLELEEYVHAARERLLPPDHLDLLAAKSNLAETRSAVGDLEGALELEEQVYAAWERLLPADHTDLLAAKSSLAETRSALGDLAGALKLEEQVHAAWERLLPEDHPDLLRAKFTLAAMRYALGDLAGALELQEHVHAARDRLLPAGHPDLLRAKQNLAVVRAALGDLAGSLELKEHVHSAWEGLLPGDHSDLLDAKSNLAATRYVLGDLAGALDLQEHVHAARERLLTEDHPDLLAAKLNLAATRSALGDLAGALELEECVHAAWERLLRADHPDLLAAKQNLAATRSAVGDLAGALELKERVHAARAQMLPEDHPDLLAAKSNLAATRYALGDLTDAHELYEYVHAAFERLLPEDHPYLIAAKQNLAVTRSGLGDIEGALELEEHVHAVWEGLLPSDHPDLLAAKHNLASTRSAVGDLAGALELEKFVHAALERLLPEDHPNLLAAKFNLAATHSNLGDLVGLRAACVSHLAAQVAVSATASAHAPRLARSAALRELDRLEWQALWSETVAVGGAPALSAQLYESLESLRLISTASAEIARAAAEVPELDAVRVELARVRRTLADASLAAPGESEAMEAWRLRLHALAEERDGLQRELRLWLNELGVSVEMPTVEALAASLDVNEVHVGFWRYERHEETEPESRVYRSTDSLLAFVVTADAQVLRVELGPAGTIEEAVDRWRAGVGAPLNARGIERGLEEPGAEPIDQHVEGALLRALLLDPVFAVVSEARELRLVLDDVLFLLPLDALPLGDGVVGDTYTIRVGSTVQQLESRGEAEAGAPSLLVLGGVDYAGEAFEPQSLLLAAASPPRDRSTGGVAGAGYAPLAGAAAEASAIAELFEGAFGVEPRTLLAGAATKAALAGGIEDARYLHIATHGWFAPDSAAVSMLDGVGESDDALRLSAGRAQNTVVGFLPETLCGLALAGANNGPAGILTAEELQTLDLTNCDLAVLSACETNVGIRRAGQGIQSLQTALHAAGARTAITSLWKVDDAATRKLFTVFYTKLWKEGLGKADALWQAKRALREEGRPLRDWAGWVLTGDPD